MNQISPGAMQQLSGAPPAPQGQPNIQGLLQAISQLFTPQVMQALGLGQIQQAPGIPGVNGAMPPQPQGAPPPPPAGQQMNAPLGALDAPQFAGIGADPGAQVAGGPTMLDKIIDKQSVGEAVQRGVDQGNQQKAAPSPPAPVKFFNGQATPSDEQKRAEALQRAQYNRSKGLPLNTPLPPLTPASTIGTRG
jgi:hypothetical protein